jgi:Leucine-rich repeat (LRR) protein
LKTLDFSGNRLTSNDKQFLLQVSTLENLILENMKTDVLDIFYRVAEKFKMLNTLSLADNDMSAFTPVNEQYRFIFPSKLININLSNCKLTDAQVKQIFSKRKNCETLRGIGLRGNGLQD